MKFSCKVSELLPVLEAVGKGTSKKTENPLLLTVLFEVKKAGKGFALMLTANSITTGIVSAIPVQEAEEGSICVDGRFLGEVLRKSPDEIIVFSEEKLKITTQIGKSKFKFLGLSNEKFPTVTKTKKGKDFFTIKSEALKSLLNKVGFAVSIDGTRPILTGFNFKIADKKLTISAVDGYKVAIVTVDIEEDVTMEFTVPANALKEVIQAVNNDLCIYCTDKNMCISTGSTYTTIQLLSGDFMNMEQIKATAKNNLEVTVTKKALTIALERASIVAKIGEKCPVMLTVKEDTMTVSSKTENNEILEDIQAVHETKLEEDFKIAFNGKFLLELLRVIEDEEITLLFGTSLTPMTVKSEDYFYFILPVKIDK